MLTVCLIRSTEWTYLAFTDTSVFVISLSISNDISDNDIMILLILLDCIKFYQANI